MDREDTWRGELLFCDLSSRALALVRGRASVASEGGGNGRGLPMSRTLGSPISNSKVGRDVESSAVIEVASRLQTEGLARLEHDVESALVALRQAFALERQVCALFIFSPCASDHSTADTPLVSLSLAMTTTASASAARARGCAALWQRPPARRRRARPSP